MVAYIERGARKTWNLVVLPRPCNGPEYLNAPRLPFSSKTEARAHCVANGLKPWNF